jgi:hypothetical protein
MIINVEVRSGEGKVSTKFSLPVPVFALVHWIDDKQFRKDLEHDSNTVPPEKDA